MGECLHRTWSRSKAFRIVLIVVSIYTALRLTMHFLYYSGMFPGGAGQLTTPLPIDLQIYMDAARRFQLQQSLYPDMTLQENLVWYEYPPAYAMLFTPFLWLPTKALLFIFTFLHLIAYGLLYVQWGRICRRAGLGRAEEALAWTLPVWMVSAAFWFDVQVLNNYVFMALLATLLIGAVLEERLGWSLVWLSIIVQIKPQWAFAAALPLFLGRWRFLLKLLVSSIVVYGLVVGATMLAGGPSYGWQQYRHFFVQLWNYSQVFPLRGPEAKYLGYGHSILQITSFLLGVTPGVRWLAFGIKALILAPLAVLVLRPARGVHRGVSQLGLDLALTLYLGAFIWLDVIAELSMGIVVFTYLLGTLERRAAKILVWVVFLLYALDDVWQFVSYAAWGDRIFVKDAIQGDLVITSPSIYIPTIMIIILSFYALLMKRIWAGWSSAFTFPRVLSGKGTPLGKGQ